MLIEVLFKDGSVENVELPDELSQRQVIDALDDLYGIHWIRFLNV